MSINLSKISISNVSDLQFNNLQKTNINFSANKKTDNDSFEKIQKEHLSKEKKQEIIKQARTKAAGWATFGSFISTIYFSVSSKEKIAQKYNLDTYKDEKLINRIKREQVLWTLPGIIPGAGFLVGGATWLYNKKANPAEIKI